MQCSSYKETLHTLTATPTCSNHSGTALYETHIASQRNLDVHTIQRVCGNQMDLLNKLFHIKITIPLWNSFSLPCVWISNGVAMWHFRTDITIIQNKNSCSILRTNKSM